MRKSEKTHPCIRFSADLRRAPAQFWVMLGECQSKFEHIAGVPLRPATAEDLNRLYLAKGVLASTAIEGNTLSEQEVLDHLEGKLHLAPSREYLAREIDNIVQACDDILGDIAAGRQPMLTASGICELNRQVLRGLSLDEHVIPGEIRRHSVGVARYRGAPAEDCEYLLDRLCRWLGGEDFQPPAGMGMTYAILKAVLAHLYLAWIHPFGDGNGRTARLVEFQVLISSGVPAPAAHLLSNHYNQTRSEYYRQLDQAGKSGGEVLPFLEYAVQGLLDGLRSQLALIREQQWDVVWRNYVYEIFRDRRGATDDRLRHLVLDLSARTQPVSPAELVEVSPRTAKAYANKTQKTVLRDVNTLVTMGLLRRTESGLVANKELILAYLPPRADVSNTGGTVPPKMGT
jgi:Fic family protein